MVMKVRERTTLVTSMLGRILDELLLIIFIRVYFSDVQYLYTYTVTQVTVFSFGILTKVSLKVVEDVKIFILIPGRR
jgi:hypothetical protein